MLSPTWLPPGTHLGGFLMGSIEWPKLPIQPEDLPKIRELLTTEEYK